ncbi:Monoglyceride lipase [Seminavis robusta]|uniref:Monoglyceride lipase n=1 Tax=Seminavis robusta TaxID=568900 RepID=A0A9N8EVG5_9STRA|nr:Monoglyceride lipase [Seminavis robusta]|eukprot:Sro2121_g315440.1 Monoglyceride lipase (356) ;mRNA; r:3172-4239
MKNTLSNLFLNINPAMAASNTSNVLMGGLGALKGMKKPPRVPFVSETVSIGDIDCCLHTYDPVSTYSGTPPKALIVFFHGWNAHGTFPTSRILADLMVANGYAFMAPDLPGHGLTSGLRGYLESGEKMIDFATKITEYAFQSYVSRVAAEKAKRGPDGGNPGLKLFLIGSSLGGNLSLHVSLRRKDLVSGIILMAPMLKISLITPFLTKMFTKQLAAALPKLEAIPIGKNYNYRDPTIAEECEKDKLKPHQVGDKGRLGTVQTLFELERLLQEQFEDVFCPCFAMVGDEDTTVNNQGAVDLCRIARSQDMALKRYPARHGLMGEPSPLVDKMQYDMIRWLDERCSSQEVFIRSSL